MKKIINKLKTIEYKEKLKKVLNKIRDFFILNRSYMFMFISLFILDISTRIATDSIGFIEYFSYEPNLFSVLWILFIVLCICSIR